MEMFVVPVLTLGVRHSFLMRSRELQVRVLGGICASYCPGDGGGGRVTGQLYTPWRVGVLRQ